MRRTLSFVFFSCLLAMTVAPARADDADLRAQFQLRYAALKTAMATREPKAIAPLFAPNFLGTDIASRNEDAAQLIKEVVALPKDPNKISTTTVLVVKQNGTSAAVDQRYEMTTTKSSADGNAHKIALTTLSTDTWTSVDGTWLLQTTQTTQADLYLDGKLVTHRVRHAPGSPMP